MLYAHFPTGFFKIITLHYLFDYRHVFLSCKSAQDKLFIMEIVFILFKVQMCLFILFCILKLHAFTIAVFTQALHKNVG